MELFDEKKPFLKNSQRQLRVVKTPYGYVDYVLAVKFYLGAEAKAKLLKRLDSLLPADGE